MMVGGSQQEILNLGFVLIVTHQQGVAIILRKLMLPNEFDPVLLSFTVREVTTELFG
ncbi:unnamed protein product [Schistosoma margrebowiei]|uniref:Uncharacterized protein n=1 Tax=Schistosoma margrebowiei TaxID=48269 RepID=A0A183MAV5_9TREM|nr:unnamed protein product [Schistosoma margrebowiei]